MTCSDRIGLGGRMLALCTILALTCVWLTPCAAMAGQFRPQEAQGPSSTATPDAPDAARWATGFGPMGVNHTVYALAVGRDGSPYAAGAFAVAGNTLANRIARWDGSAWRALGSGVAGTDFPPAVYALAFGPDGSLYAGGWFTAAGGVAAHHIARWDGSVWHPLGSGTGGEHPAVGALAFGADGSLYAGGTFTTAGGVAADRIARWDGTAWHPVGSGISGAGIPAVRALAFGPDGSLYAGGVFTAAGGVPANYVARWDGSAWHALGSGIGGESFPYVRALAVGPDGSLYAGGQFGEAGGVPATDVARWDGTAWHSLGSGMGGPSYPAPCVYSLAVGMGGSLYAGGLFTTAGGTPAPYIARWDGSAWHSVDSGMNYDVYALAPGPGGSLYVGGAFTRAGGVAASRIVRWDQVASSWHAVGGGNGLGSLGSPPIWELARGPDGSIYAGGWFNTAGRVAANYVVRWDGYAWRPLGSGVGSAVSALAFGPDGSVYVGGSFTTAGGVPANRVARWDGSAWHALGSGITGSYSHVLTLAVGPDGSVYAAGDFDTAGGVPANSIARWDGMAWHPLGSGLENCGSDRCVDTLVFGPDGSLYAGGPFTTAGGAPANRIARWDGTAWHPLGSGVSGLWVYALAFGPDGSLYAGGWFTSAGGATVNHIARWDGSAWHPLGSGVSGQGNPVVMALAFGLDGALYAAGDFGTAGGVPANSIARWDGTAWHALGSGLEGCGYMCALSLAVGQDGSLYAGGTFALAGGRPSSAIGRWIGDSRFRALLPMMVHSD